MKDRKKNCNSCHAPNQARPYQIKGENCYICRKKMHEKLPSSEITLKGRLVLLSVSLALILVSVYSIYTQHIYLPYVWGKRHHHATYEFSGVEVVMPVMALMLYSVGVLVLAIGQNYKHFNSWIYKRVLQICLLGGAVIYLGAIFFGHKV